MGGGGRAEEGEAEDGTAGNDGELNQHAFCEKERCCGQDGDGDSGSVGGEGLAHAPQGKSDDSDGHDLQAVQPFCGLSAELLHAVCEKDQGDCRGEGESQPSGQGTEDSGTTHSDGHAKLAAGRTGQELA